MDKVSWMSTREDGDKMWQNYFLGLYEKIHSTRLPTDPTTTGELSFPKQAFAGKDEKEDNKLNVLEGY